MTFQSYSDKRGALRGLTRHLGVAAEGHDLPAMLSQEGGRWGFDPEKADAAVGLKGVSEEDENLILFCGHANCPGCGVHLSNGISDFEGMIDRHGSEKAAFKYQQFEHACMGCWHQWGKPIEAPKGSQPRSATTKTYENKSTVKGAVQVCHDFFNANPTLRRKDAVQGAVDLGIAFYTARTQYQKWFKAREAK